MKKTVFIITAVLFASCYELNNAGENFFTIIEITADGIINEAGTSKLTITFNEDIPGLNSDDIKINANFSVIKQELIKIEDSKYELGIIPGRTGQIKAGLDPYRGFTGWDAKPVNVYAVYYFNLNGNSAITITDYRLSGGSIEIPNNFNGIPVTVLGNSSFSNKNLTGVKIPDSITEIGDYAFARNNIANITIPVNVKSIGNYAFYESNIKELVFLNTEMNSTIGNYAFTGNDLTEIIIPNNVIHIGTGAFKWNDLSDIVISESLITIEAELFANNKLTDVIIPNNVTLIKREAFLDNDIETLVIGSEVKKIETLAFWGNKFKSITIGSGVNLEKASFGEIFENAYNIENNKKGAIYIWKTESDPQP